MLYIAGKQNATNLKAVITKKKCNESVLCCRRLAEDTEKLPFAKLVSIVSESLSIAIPERFQWQSLRYLA